MDLIPVARKTGLSRPLEMISDRSRAVFKNWLADRHPEWKSTIEVVAMDGFTGFITAAGVEVLDPLHVVKLASDALDKSRQRIQREQHGRRGLKDDPLYQARGSMTLGFDVCF